MLEVQAFVEVAQVDEGARAVHALGAEFLLLGGLVSARLGRVRVGGFGVVVVFLGFLSNVAFIVGEVFV